MVSEFQAKAVASEWSVMPVQVAEPTQATQTSNSTKGEAHGAPPTLSQLRKGVCVLYARPSQSERSPSSVMKSVDGMFHRMSSTSTPAACTASLPLAQQPMPVPPPSPRRSSQTAAPVADGVQLFRLAGLTQSPTRVARPLFSTCLPNTMPYGDQPDQPPWPFWLVPASASASPSLMHVPKPKEKPVVKASMPREWAGIKISYMVVWMSS